MTSTIRNRSTGSNSDEASVIEVNVRKLHYYHELSLWQQDNHFIKSGYVKETSSYKACIDSLLYLHNETVNIYSHLIPSILTLAAIIYYINYRLTIYDTYLGWEKLNFIQFGVAVTVCLFCSSSFHCFKSHSLKISKFGNQLDYFGIVILITCSLNSIILFAFYDERFWKYTFIGVFLVLGTICAIMTLNPKFSHHQYRPFRSLMFILFGLSGVLPVVEAIRLYGYETTVQRCGMNWLLLEGFFYILGAVLYAMRIPERFTHIDEATDLLDQPISGKFDYFGHAHQIFHIMVVLAAFFHWLALLDCYHYLHNVILSSAI